MNNLFDPNGAKTKADERQQCERVRQITLSLLPDSIKEGLHLNVSQVKIQNT